MDPQQFRKCLHLVGKQVEATRTNIFSTTFLPPCWIMALIIIDEVSIYSPVEKTCRPSTSLLVSVWPYKHQ